MTIENNRKRILESGTEVNFIEMADYINEKQNTRMFSIVKKTLF